MTYPNLVAPSTFLIDAHLPGGVVTHHEFETFEQVVIFQEEMQFIRIATTWRQ